MNGGLRRYMATSGRRYSAAPVPHKRPQHEKNLQTCLTVSRLSAANLQPPNDKTRLRLRMINDQPVSSTSLEKVAAPFRSFRLVFLSFLLLTASHLMTGCGEHVVEQPLSEAAKSSDYLVFTIVDTNSASMRLRFHHMLFSRSGAAFPIASNEVIPFSGPQIEPDTIYGDTALVMLATNAGLKVQRTVLFTAGRSHGDDKPFAQESNAWLRAMQGEGAK